MIEVTEHNSSKACGHIVSYTFHLPRKNKNLYDGQMESFVQLISAVLLDMFAVSVKDIVCLFLPVPLPLVFLRVWLSTNV